MGLEDKIQELSQSRGIEIRQKTGEKDEETWDQCTRSSSRALTRGKKTFTAEEK